MIKIPTQKTVHCAHMDILVRIDQIRQRGHSYGMASPLLAEFYEVLLNYVNLQVQPVYRDLGSRNSKNQEVLKILEFLEHDITELRLEILQFYDRFSDQANPIRGRAFSMEFRQFSDRIIQRVEMEEERFLPLLPN